MTSRPSSIRVRDYPSGPTVTTDRGTPLLALPAGLAVDRSNNVIVAGHSYASGSSEDYATIKYSAAGLPLWTNRYRGPRVLMTSPPGWRWTGAGT